MGDDYCSAAGKHLDDARLLLDSHRFDNSAYLSGYVVECALKLAVQLGGRRAKQYGHDLSRLVGPGLRLACQLSPSLRRYPVPSSPAVNDVCGRWHPALRYQKKGTIAPQEAERWWAGADQVYRAIVVRFVLDGTRVAV